MSIRARMERVVAVVAAVVVGVGVSGVAAHRSTGTGTRRDALGSTDTHLGLPPSPPTTAPVSKVGAPGTISVAPTAAAPWSETDVAMTFGGLARSYLLILPTGPVTAPLPVLVELHGHSTTPAGEAIRTAFQSVTGPAVLVYPAGVDESWNAGHCCQPAEGAGVDDVGFIEAVVTRVIATVADVDQSRVYLAGYSNGAKMALTLACDDAQQWRAVAVYGATAVAPCPHPPALSLLVAASRLDPEVTIGPGGPSQSVEGFVEPTVDEQVATARADATCGPLPTTTAVTGTLTVTRWDCADGREVALALYSDGDHGWPAGDPSTPSGADVMWAFFTAVAA